jgi:hypothetical protein
VAHLVGEKDGRSVALRALETSRGGDGPRLLRLERIGNERLRFVISPLALHIRSMRAGSV